MLVEWVFKCNSYRRRSITKALNQYKIKFFFRDLVGICDLPAKEAMTLIFGWNCYQHFLCYLKINQFIQWFALSASTSFKVIFSSFKLLLKVNMIFNSFLIHFMKFLWNTLKTKNHWKMWEKIVAVYLIFIIINDICSVITIVYEFETWNRKKNKNILNKNK